MHYAALAAGLRSRRTIGASAFAVLAITVTACGNEVTAVHDWYSTAHHDSSVVTVAGVSENEWVVSGVLDTDSKADAAPGTLFREQCGQPRAPGAPWTCVALVNAGQRVYVASGTTADPYDHTLRVLTGSHGSLTIATVGAGTKTVNVKISARP